MTRAKRSPADMVRFAVGPDGAVHPDVRARLPGRGAWVDGVADTVRLAIKRKSFARAFKRDCAVDPDLAARVAALMEADGLQALSFANKAGLVVCGATKVEAALDAGKVRMLLHATDGSPDGIRKLAAAARRGAARGHATPVHMQIFCSDQLDLALGRSHVIHAALLGGGASEAFLVRAARLGRYRGSDAEPSAEVLIGVVPDGA